MIKIELALKIEELPTGRAKDFIWLKGQRWPVPTEDEERVIRVEAFGDELKEIGPKFSGGTSIKNEAGEETCRTWYTVDARYVSTQMRVFYP